MKPGIFYATILTLVFSICFNALYAQEITDEEITRQKREEERRLKRDHTREFGEDLYRVHEILEKQDQDATIAMSQKKVDKALRGFMETEFMAKYKDLKLEAETLVGAFKVHARDLHPADVAKVQKAYAKIADKFNVFLGEIKNDFMDSKKLKFIQDQPEMYSNSMSYKLNELKDDYAQDFQLVVADITGSDLYSAIPIVAILELIKLAVDFSSFIAKRNFESRRVKEEELREFFLIPYSFRSWDDIQVSEGDISRIREEENAPQEDEEIKPFEEPTNSAKPKPKKKNNDN